MAKIQYSAKYDFLSLFLYAASQADLVPHIPGQPCSGCGFNRPSSDSRYCYGHKHLAEDIGVTDRTVTRWVKQGCISELAADRAATRLGVHPSFIWGR
jgi:hypothetical protein